MTLEEALFKITEYEDKFKELTSEKEQLTNTLEIEKTKQSELSKELEKVKNVNYELFNKIMLFDKKEEIKTDSETNEEEEQELSRDEIIGNIINRMEV